MPRMRFGVVTGALNFRADSVFGRLSRREFSRRAAADHRATPRHCGPWPIRITVTAVMTRTCTPESVSCGAARVESTVQLNWALRMAEIRRAQSEAVAILCRNWDGREVSGKRKGGTPESGRQQM